MSERRLRLGDFVIDLGAESLSRDGEAIHLKPQVFAVLAYLVGNAGKLVTRDALIDHVWGRCEVDFDANLNTIMLQIRRALGDTAEAPRYVETVPRKGYRVVAAVTEAAPVTGRRRWARRAPAAAATLVVAAAVIGPVLPGAAPQRAASAETHILYARGKEALQDGDFFRAAHLLEKTLEASPGFAPAHACLALAYVGLGGGSEAGIRRAKTQLERAAAIDPNDPMMLTVAAQIALVHERQLEKARSLLDKALAQETADSHTYLLSAWHYSVTGEHRKAREAVQHALLLDPLSPRINESAAKIYEAADDLENARRFSDLARELTEET